MNKTTIRIITSIIVIMLLIPCLGIAQDKDEPNTVLCVTYVYDWGEGATISERDSIFALVDENVVKKNKFIKSLMRYQHFYGANSEDFIFLYEFNGSGLEIILKSSEEATRLAKEWKKDKEERDAFYALFDKYFKSGHSDEIYTLITKVSN